MGMFYDPEIGVLDIRTTTNPEAVSAAEYLRDGPANKWPAPERLSDWLSANWEEIEAHGYYDEPAEIADALLANGRATVIGAETLTVILIDLDREAA